MRLRETSVEIEVPFHHVDMLGVVWHGHYFKYMEAARSALLGSCGLDAGDLIGPRYLFYVIESHCRHAYPIRYHDKLRITAWVKDWEHRLYIAYEIWNRTRDWRSARGHTILAVTDPENNLLLETPHEIRERLGA